MEVSYVKNNKEDNKRTSPSISDCFCNVEDDFGSPYVANVYNGLQRT